MKRLSKDQIEIIDGRKEKITLIFMIVAFATIVINAFYLYWLYKSGGEKMFLLDLMEFFNILLSFAINVLIIWYLRNNINEVSKFLWKAEDFLLENKEWKNGKKSVEFMSQYRMYSSCDEMQKDINDLKLCNSKRSRWALISAFMLLFVLLFNSVEVLFCGETARVMMIWIDDVAFFFFFIPKCIFALLLLFSLFKFLYYKDKIRLLLMDTSKCRITARDVYDSI